MYLTAKQIEDITKFVEEAKTGTISEETMQKGIEFVQFVTERREFERRRTIDYIEKRRKDDPDYWKKWPKKKKVLDESAD